MTFLHSLRLTTLSCLLLFSSSLSANIPMLDLSELSDMISLSSELIGHIEDRDYSLDIEDVYKHPEAFEAVPANRIYGSYPAAHWLAFDIEGDKDMLFDIFLEIANAHIGDYQLWMYKGATPLYHTRQGDNYKFSNRFIAHNFFIHRLPFEDGPIRLIFRIDQEGQETNFPITFYRNAQFVRHTLQYKIIHGLVIGLFLITTIITLCLYFVNWYKYFLYEVIISIASVMYVLSEEGYGLMFFWPNHPVLNGYSRPLSIGIIVVFSLLFTLDFIELKRASKTFMKIAKVMIGIYVAYWLFAHPIDVFNLRTSVNIGLIISIFLVLTIIISVYTAFISLWAWVKLKSTDGMIVFFIFMATILALLVRLLALQGIGLSSDWILHTGFITRAIHVPLLGGYIIYTAIKALQRSRDEQISLLEERSERSKAFIERIDSERQRISMALHDSAGSIVTGIQNNLRMFKEEQADIGHNDHYQESLRLTSKLQEEIRHISNDLLPSSILKLGLRSEIQRILSTLESTYDLTTRLETNDKTDIDIDQKIIFHLYYIVRESLDNIVKYAEASSVLIQYYIYDEEINLLIEDDGKGFRKEEVLERRGNGLRNMDLRVGWLKGEIDIYSEEGTSISINIPLTDIK